MDFAFLHPMTSDLKPPSLKEISWKEQFAIMVREGVWEGGREGGREGGIAALLFVASC